MKYKNLKDADFVVCGYIAKGNHMTSAVLGQYRGGSQIYKVHVPLCVGGALSQDSRYAPNAKPAISCDNRK